MWISARTQNSCLTGFGFVRTQGQPAVSGDGRGRRDEANSGDEMRRKTGIGQRIRSVLARYFPERRIFLRSDTDTRFILLSPGAQLTALTGSALFVAWSIIATSILMFDTIGAGSVRDQALREQLLYERRLNEISAERDQRASEAEMAHARFNSAIEQISDMQLSFLESEERWREMERGIEVIQSTLRKTMIERDAAREQLAEAQAETPDIDRSLMAAGEQAETLDFLSGALSDLAAQRDTIADERDTARTQLADLELEQKLIFERNDRIFGQLEDAVSLSIAPLDGMFAAAGMSSDRILSTVRAGYSGQGGPMTPLTFSTKGQEPDPDSLRANAILQKLDELNIYRIAYEKVPLVLPLKAAFRYTSPFGMRWGHMHEGIDMASSYGTSLYATADGVVIFAGWSSGYGRLVKIRHEFGIETRYGHMSKIRVQVGQRVSRGDQIGDMGNSGHSTGTHVHYEVRVNGTPVNPMKFIKAGQNVF